MSDLILLEGDTVHFNSNFGSAKVNVRTTVMRSSGKLSVKGRHACVEGDERQISISGCSYTTDDYTIPGSGTLKISGLTTSHCSSTMKDEGKTVLLRGGEFKSTFKVDKPAKMPILDLLGGF